MMNVMLRDERDDAFCCGCCSSLPSSTENCFLFDQSAPDEPQLCRLARLDVTELLHPSNKIRSVVYVSLTSTSLGWHLHLSG